VRQSSNNYISLQRNTNSQQHICSNNYIFAKGYVALLLTEKQIIFAVNCLLFVSKKIVCFFASLLYNGA
jgi:hypothetical protein